MGSDQPHESLENDISKNEPINDGLFHENSVKLSVNNVEINAYSVYNNYDQYPENQIFAFKRRRNPQKKVYVKTMLGLKGQYGTTVSLLDCGADVCCIRYDVLRNMFSDVNLLHSKIKKTNDTVTGVSGPAVTVMGLITLDLKFSEDSQSIPCHFYVLSSENKNTSLGIIGISSFSYLDLQLTWYYVNGKKVPEVTRERFGRVEPVDYYHLSEYEARCVSQSFTIPPNSCKQVNVSINHFFTYGNDDIFYIQGTHDVKNVKIIPSISMVEREGKEFYVKATVENRSNNAFSGKLDFHIENASSDEVLPITRENKPKLSMYRTLHEVVVEPDENNDCPSRVTVTKNFSENLIMNNETSLFKSFSNYDIHSIQVKPEPTFVNIVTTPNFPDHPVGYDPESDNNNCNIGESLSENKLKGKITISEEKKDVDFNGKDTINLSIQDPDPLDERTPDGFELPKEGYDKISAEDILKLEDHPEEIRKYLKDIFLDNYPDVVSCHNFDLGNLSYYLGYYTLKLKKGAKLPKYSKLYYLSAADSKHLKDILTFLEGNEIISKSPQGGDEVKMCCSAYLVSRKNRQNIARLVVNYIPLNRITDFESPIIPTTIDILSNLKGSTYFTNLDLTGAFNSISLHPSCRHLTNFITIHGSYYSNRLITGGVGSPGVLHRFMDRLLNYVPQRDEHGNVIWDEESLARLTFDPILNCHVFFDDLIIYSSFVESHEKSRDIHFELVKKVIARLSLYKGKISLEKSSFFKSKINFLGWNIMQDYIFPQNQRIEKVVNFPLPTTCRMWRSFVGTVNSLRLVLSFSVLKNVTTLADLTSEKGNHANPTKQQLAAFEDIKKKLTTAPLFTALIDPEAPKVIYTDAASSANSSVGSVLAQLSKPKNPKLFLPKYLYMADPCHRLIHSYDLKCVPCRHLRLGEGAKEFIKTTGPLFPPETEYLESENFGLDPNEDSLALALKTLFVLHNMSIEEERLRSVGKKCHDFMRKDILGQQVKTYHFNESNDAYQSYLKDLKNFKFQIDKEFCIFECLAIQLIRPFVVISSLKEHADDPIFRYKTDLSKPPFFVLIYEHQSKLICKVGYIDKEQVFDQSSMRGSFEICSYYSHTLPQSLRSSHILEVEALAIMMSLQAFDKLIGSSEALLVCDSLCLYFVFNKEIQQSSEKIQRWSSQIFSRHPNLKVTFCKSQQNLADLFTRNFNIKVPQFKLTGVERLATSIDEKIFDHINMKTFGMDEWRKWVEKHPEFLIKPVTTPKNTKRIQSIKTDDQVWSELLKPSEGKENVQNLEISKNTNEVFVDSLNKETPDRVPENLPEEAVALSILDITEDPSFQKSISNYLNISESLDILKNRLSPDKISDEQRLEFSELYEEISTSPNLTIDKAGVDFFLKNGLIYRKLNTLSSQLLFPTKLVTILIAYNHLSTNHSGTSRMMLALEPFFHKGMKKRVEEFSRTCLMCLLNNYSTTVQKFGTYPVVNAPFQNLHLDFIENLKTCEGYKNLLVVVDHFTMVSFTIAFRTSKSSEFLHKFLYYVFQPYKPKNLYCDNSLTFLAPSTLKTLGSFGINVIFGVPNHPYSKGFAEAYIKCYRTAMRKYMTNDETESWLYLPILISQQLNTSPTPRSKSKPFELLYGKSRFSESLDEHFEGTTLLHPILTKSETEVLEQKQKWQVYLKGVEEAMNEEKKELYKNLNKTRKAKTFPPGKIVFIRRRMPDNFETVYTRSIYKVIQERVNTCLIFRISDGYMTLCHKNQMKAYEPDNKLFRTLPSEIKALCTHLEEEGELSKSNFNKLLDYEDFTIPEAILDLLHKDPESVLKKEFGNEDTDSKPSTSK